MKKHYILTCLMAIVMISSCIKEEGEPYIVMRSDINSKTLESSIKGYMHGEANFDTITNNSFKIYYNEKNEEKLDFFFEINSNYTYDVDLNQDTIIASGYVYSRENDKPVLNAESCVKFSESEVKGTNRELEFNGEAHNLVHNADYYVRSYVITAKHDTCYSPTIIKHKTIMPSDVWIKKNDAPQLLARTEAITAQTENGQVYIYGGRGNIQCYEDMWVYNSKEDAWEQKASFEVSSSPKQLVLPTERCNGAAFMVVDDLKQDTLMYILGGEDINGEATAHCFIYSLKNNRFNNSADHPHNRSHVEDLPMAMSGMVAFTLENTMEPAHFVGMGRVLVKAGNTQTAVQPTIYQYIEQYDKVDNEKPDDHIFTWQNAGTLSIDGQTAKDQTAVGFDKPVCITLSKDKIIIGSGISSRDEKCSNKFYKVSVGQGNMLTYELLPSPPEEFEPRQNATGFYLNYTKANTQFDHFYVGTGVNDEGKPLKDFWAFDLGKKTWKRIADCGNIYREGAVGFKILRTDDIYSREYNEPHERGIVSFGNGTINPNDKISDCGLRNDVWEYLP